MLIPSCLVRQEDFIQILTHLSYSPRVSPILSSFLLSSVYLSPRPFIPSSIDPSPLPPLLSSEPYWGGGEVSSQLVTCNEIQITEPRISRFHLPPSCYLMLPLHPCLRHPSFWGMLRHHSLHHITLVTMTLYVCS